MFLENKIRGDKKCFTVRCQWYGSEYCNRAPYLE